LSYPTAIERLSVIERDEADPAINPICRGFVYTHGGRTARCIVLLHGYTNGPAQFRAFAERLYAQGHNVYVPRAPGHGHADRLTTALGELNEAKLIAWLDQSLAIAHGLGERVDVLGLSLGGSLAAYAAQWRPAVHQAVVIAPVLGTPSIADWAVWPVATLAALGPNQFRWWDAQQQDKIPGPPHAYPRYSTRALGKIVRLGLAILRAAGKRPPAARDLVVVTNATDQAVSNAPIELLVARWRAHGATVRTHCFPAALGLIHDCIDPTQPRQQIEVVYPALLELMG
jgi:carboxylesterase